MALSATQTGNFNELVNYCLISGEIDLGLYTEYDVKRGLRDSNGKGVLTGLTEIADVLSYRIEDGRPIPSDGQLFYQGYNVYDLIKGHKGKRYAFEEAT